MWRTRPRMFSRIVGEYGPWSHLFQYAQVIFMKSGIEAHGIAEKRDPQVTEPFKDKSFHVVAKQVRLYT